MGSRGRMMRVQLRFGVGWGWLLKVSGKSTHFANLHDLYSSLSVLTLRCSLVRYIGSWFQTGQVDYFRVG